MMLIDSLRIWLILLLIGNIEGQRRVFFADRTTYPTGTGPKGLTAADVNGDNQTDIIVANLESNNVGIRLNQGNGTFTTQKTYSTGTSPYSVSAADLNGDNKPDLITPNYNLDTISVLLNKGNDTYANQVPYATSYGPSFLSVDDVNGDIYLDIVVSHYGAARVTVHLNRGNGTFINAITYTVSSVSFGLTTGDLNGDNKPDIIVANYDADNVGVLLNRGNGTFMTEKTYPTGLNPGSVALGDVNGDNKTDIITANAGSSTISILLNRGNGTFQSQITYPTSYIPSSVATADINADSWLDIIVVNYYSNNIVIFLNIGNGAFVNQMTYVTESSPTRVVAVDVNSDQKLDILVANYESNSFNMFLCLGYEEITTPLSAKMTTEQNKILPETSVARSTKPLSISRLSSTEATSDSEISSTEMITSAPISSEKPMSTSQISTTEPVSTSETSTVEAMSSSQVSSTEARLLYQILSTKWMPTSRILSTKSTSIVQPSNTGLSSNTRISGAETTSSIQILSTKSTSTVQRSRTGVLSSTQVSSAKTISNILISSTKAMPSSQILSTKSISILQASSTKAKSTYQISTCSAPQVTLIPNANSSEPIPFRRSEDLSIISSIKSTCSQLFRMTTRWMITDCTTSCSNSIELSSSIVQTSSELYMPSATLPYGIYQIELTVEMTNSSWLKTSKSTYVQIIRSNIIVNSFYLGTSMITNGYAHDLHLDPGVYSIDPDNNYFNSSDWTYEYYCRVDGIISAFLEIENSTCLSNRIDNQTTWRYSNSIRSSLTVLGKSLQSNRTYQFIIRMKNRRDASRQANGSVLVNVEDTTSPMIAIGCVISSMCTPHVEYQYVNPTTQVALFSVCTGNCSSIESIAWNIYSGEINSSTNYTHWSLFNQTNSLEDAWFFGRNTRNFTSTNQLFLAYPHIQRWQFEVIYSFRQDTSTSALNFLLSQPPMNGSCSISPSSGTTSTLFTITCADWFDEDGIKDYSFYTWTNDYSQKITIAFSSIEVSQIRLPAGDNQTGRLYLMAIIRDQFNCITEYNISSVVVVPDSSTINDLINNLQSSSNQVISNDPIAQLLASGNQNTVGQTIIALSQQLNQMNTQSINTAVSNGIPPTSISISSLGSQRLSASSIDQFNQSAFIELNKGLNSRANTREYLISFVPNLGITTSNSIQLQSTSLAQLTQATDELTRTTLTIASQRCYQLTLALSSMAAKIAYEDARTSATQLIQCASNVLSAVNGPLQERRNVLDLDATRATAFPADYDTDLESEWAKLNLRGDQNSYYQKQLASQIQTQIDQLISKLTSTLNIYLNIGQQSLINTSQVLLSLKKQSIDSLTSQPVANTDIRLPSTFQTNRTLNSTVAVRVFTQPLAIFGSSRLSAHTNLSRSISLSILDQDENEIPVQASKTDLIEMIIPRDPNAIASSMILQNVTSTDSTPHQQLFHLHYVNLSSRFPISIHIEIDPLNISIAYLLIYKFDQIPQLDQSTSRIDGWTTLLPSNLSNDSLYTYFLDNQLTQNHQSLVFGIRELNLSESLTYSSKSSIKNPPTTDERYNFTSNYRLRIYSSGCYYLDEQNQWNGEGLTVGSLTNHQQTQCYSTHLKTTFAGGFLVLPQPINWQYVFANADFIKNKTIYLTVISVSVIYLLVMMYARYKDKKDLEKLGVIPLSDNDPSDGYFYQILVFTGHRKDSETKSEVQFILAGDQDQTQVRTFANSKREIFQRSAIDGFLMSVPRCLGPLNYLHIWHDNSGKGSSASWFLKYLIVRDLQTMETSYFIAQRWFAVERDDSKIERAFPVANEVEMKKFSYLLSKKAYHSISDDHLWFSIFSRPPTNQFTRVQRCTCCFVLFFLSMFLNIMYYDLSTETKTNNSTNSFNLGPLILSREQIVIGITVELLALIPSLLLVQIFRRLRPRGQPKKKTKFTFPWWFKFIAYGLCLILVAVSMFFIIVRGIEFGDLKTQQWLTSIVTGFFSSILLTQPLKILCLAIFFTVICRKSNNDKHVEGYFVELDEKNEEYFPKKSYSIYHRTTRSKRLSKNEIVYARDERIKEVQMWSLLHRILTYLVFLSLLFLLTYSNRTTDPHLQVQHLRSYLDFDDISTADDYWSWLTGHFVGNLRAQKWYNGDQPRNLSGYLNDRTNRLIGWATMRQLRIKSDLCPYRKWNYSCQGSFSLSNEQTSSSEIGWTNVTLTKVSSTIEQAFQYRSAAELNSYTIAGDHGKYRGGGYVYEYRGRLSDLQGNLSMLHRFQWIDRQTRAVIIQLNLYNPNVQLFTSVTLLTEFLLAGGLQTTVQIEPIDFYLSLTSTSQLICTILYLIVIVHFMFIEIQSFSRLKREYFQNFWFVIELGIIVCSWMGVALYISRYRECSRISQLFTQTNGYTYVNLQYLTYLNNFLTFMYGFCCFLGTMKMIRLFRLNARIYLFISTLRIGAKDLLGFALMFSVVFVAYMCLFHLLFSSQLWSASSLLQTAGMLFEIILMKFDAHQLIDADAFLGPLAFSLFIFLGVFVCLSMFITIITANFRQARENQEKNEEKIYSFMWKRFVRWTGLRKRSEEEVHEEYDAVMRRQYVDRFTLLEKRVDELLHTLNRVHTIKYV